MYCRGYSEEIEKTIIGVSSMKMSSADKNNQVRNKAFRNREQKIDCSCGYSLWRNEALKKICQIFVTFSTSRCTVEFIQRKSKKKYWRFFMKPETSKLRRLDGGSYYVFHHFCITLTVMFSSNEDSNFFRNQK